MRPRGCGNGKDPGHHLPHRSWSRRRRLPARPGPGRHLHGPCRRRDALALGRSGCDRHPGAHLPLRRSASVDILLAHGDRRSPPRDREVQGPPRRHRRPPPRPVHRPRPHPRPVGRGRVGEGHHDPARGLRPEGRRPASRSPRRPGTRHCCPGAGGLRGGQDRARSHRFRGRPAPDGRHPPGPRGHR